MTEVGRVAQKNRILKSRMKNNNHYLLQLRGFLRPSVRNAHNEGKHL